MGFKVHSSFHHPLLAGLWFPWGDQFQMFATDDNNVALVMTIESLQMVRAKISVPSWTENLQSLIGNFVMGSLFSFSVDLVCFFLTGQGI